MKHIIEKILVYAAILSFSFSASAQAQYFDDARVGESGSEPPVVPVAAEAPVTSEKQAVALVNKMVNDTVFRIREIPELDAYLDSIYAEPVDMVMGTLPLPGYFFMPAIYDHYSFPDTTSVFAPQISGYPELRWVEEEGALKKKIDDLRYNLFFRHPEVVEYNVSMLPEAPKQYHAVIDPSSHTIEIRELETAKDADATINTAAVKKRHWIRSFDASLQFSQAYVSPNWYQGGNNNLNMLATLYYNVKLNTEYHPNLIFETTAQYKLGVNNAPNDTVHNYNISDDLFQVNTTFGVKAARRWYYSFTGQFKTQLLNNYAVNARNPRSAFMSPGELTAGIGMTYNYVNPKKTFTCDVSINPISYSLKTCLNEKINPQNYNIDAGHKTSHNFGSSAEIRLTWKIAYNINFNSRIFAFSDYDSFQADWENTLQFIINRFLTSKVYVHARYDTKTPPCDDDKWKKLQVKEILSIGFSYRFRSI